MKRVLCLILVLVLCLGLGLEAFAYDWVTMYAADGRTRQTRSDQVDAYKAVGWYAASDYVTMYALDGRTRQTRATEIKAYMGLGWYPADAYITMYALSGRTRQTRVDQVGAYQAVGWYLGSSYVPLYAANGRTRQTKASEIGTYLNLGWSAAKPAISWEFVNGTLYIRGSGNMPDYHFDDGPSGSGSAVAPWFDMDIRGRLTNVVIEQGVRSIGRDAFVHSYSLSSISIPSSVTYVGQEAFWACGLKNIYYEGTQAQWNALVSNSSPRAFQSSGGSVLDSARIVFYQYKTN